MHGGRCATQRKAAPSHDDDESHMTAGGAGAHGGLSGTHRKAATSHADVESHMTAGGPAHGDGGGTQAHAASLHDRPASQTSDNELSADAQPEGVVVLGAHTSSASLHEYPSSHTIVPAPAPQEGATGGAHDIVAGTHKDPSSHSNSAGATTQGADGVGELLALELALALALRDAPALDDAEAEADEDGLVV